MRQDRGMKEQFIITASKLFEQKGYYAVGINEVLKESKAPKGSLYYYFPKGKEELAIEAIRYAKVKIMEQIKKVFEKYNTPIEALEKNLLYMANIVDEEKKLNDISIGLIALETYNSNENLREECNLVFKEMKEFYTDKLLDFGMNKETALEVAVLIVASIEGAITLSLTSKNGNSLRILAKNINNIIK